MKTLTLSLLAVFGLAAAVPAMAFGRSFDIGEGIIPDQTRSSIRDIVRTAARHFLNFRKQTPLSDEQKTALSKILAEHREEIRAQITEGRDARRAMEKAVKENGSTKAAADKIGDAARDRALLMARIAKQMRPLLTPEQQKQLEEAHSEIESLVDSALASALR
ncbi:Spy/CpxP family protein refolding chaperone [Prosthecobacter sp.]|uniref:Spy/CpxP family protein refolding chaperone n=1 Tax=Prosthecobacter sp. TaxID=1965333 RepID=UPI00378325A3